MKSKSCLSLHDGKPARNRNVLKGKIRGSLDRKWRAKTLETKERKNGGGGRPK
jgi:hypothetical protein